MPRLKFLIHFSYEKVQESPRRVFLAPALKVFLEPVLGTPFLDLPSDLGVHQKILVLIVAETIK